MNNVKTMKISPKIVKNTKNTIVTALSCIMLATGCSGSNLANYSGVEPQNRNEVEMVRIPYSIKYNAGEASIGDAEIAKLNLFLRSSSITYGDEFSMDFPLDRNGNLSELDGQRLEYTSNILKDSGLYMSATLTPWGMEPSANTGRLLISKYVVTIPDCGNWTQPSTPNFQNAPLGNIGCASQANLGLMIANPRDLIIGAEGGAPNTERTAGAVERYQNRTIEVAPTAASSN